MIYRANAGQSQAQDFVVTATDTYNGVVVDVIEKDTNAPVIAVISTGDFRLHGDRNLTRQSALEICSQNSGDGKAIAKGVFIGVSDSYKDGVFTAVIHRSPTKPVF